MKHIVSFSGGKDSTAMLLMMLEKGMRVDRIICVDTTKEFPAMYRHIEKVQSMCPVKIEIVKIDFDYWFSKYELIKGKNKGKNGYGWPSFKFRWCSGLKMDAFRSSINGIYAPYSRNQRSLSLIRGAKVHLGYSSDEVKRAKIEKSRNETYPLIEWGVTAKQALEYCYSKGFGWEGLYEKFHRVSCWCCPLSRIGELRVLYNDFPELWAELIEMDKKSFRKFRTDYSVDELTERFANENLYKRYKNSIINRI